MKKSSRWAAISAHSRKWLHSSPLDQTLGEYQQEEDEEDEEEKENCEEQREEGSQEVEGSEMFGVADFLMRDEGVIRTTGRMEGKEIQQG